VTPRGKLVHRLWAHAPGGLRRSARRCGAPMSPFAPRKSVPGESVTSRTASPRNSETPSAGSSTRFYAPARNSLGAPKACRARSFAKRKATLGDRRIHPALRSASPLISRAKDRARRAAASRMVPSAKSCRFLEISERPLRPMVSNSDYDLRIAIRAMSENSF
jgi:hypothetical protein